jgi:hypothetical protein
MRVSISFLFLLFAHIARATSANQNSGWNIASLFSKLQSLIENIPFVGQSGNNQNYSAFKFLEALQNRNTKNAQECLTNGLSADYKYTSKPYNSLLIEACKEENLTIVNQLIDSGADVNYPNLHGITPLLSACFDGNCEICELLIKKEAKINHQDEKGFTPLMIASINEKPKVVKILIKSGADLNRKNSKGFTALDMTGNRKIIKYLKNPESIDTFSDRLEESLEIFVDKLKIPIVIIFTTVLANEALGGALGNKLWQIIEDFSKPSPVKQKNLLEKLKTKIASFKLIQHSMVEKAEHKKTDVAKEHNIFEKIMLKFVELVDGQEVFKLPTAGKQTEGQDEEGISTLPFHHSSGSHSVSTLLAEIPTNDDQSSIL